MAVRRPRAAAVKEAEVLLWVCRCEAVLSVAKLNSFLAKTAQTSLSKLALLNDCHSGSKPHFNRNNGRSPYACFWLKARFHSHTSPFSCHIG